MDQERREIDQFFADWAEGASGALDALILHVYDELHRLAEGYLRVERSDHTLQAEPLYREALAMDSELLGRQHLRTAPELLNLGLLLYDLGSFEEARPSKNLSTSFKP